MWRSRFFPSKIMTTGLIALLVVLTGACQKSVIEEPSMQIRDPFAVGSSTLFIHDQSRPYDSVAGVNTGIRTLVTEVWYPVNHDQIAAIAGKGETLRHATYGDYVFGSRAVHKLMMTQTTFFHLTPETVKAEVNIDQIEEAIDELFNRERASYLDAPLADTGAAFAVVVMSHGDAGSRYNMETVCEYLAAQGYVVIAPEHTGNSPYTMTGSDPALSAMGGNSDFKSLMSDVLPLLNEEGAYGNTARFGQSYAPGTGRDSPLEELLTLDRALLERVNDLRATLDELERMNLGGKFAARLDLKHIGLIGRSFGGATTLAALNMESRFTAGVAVVPPAWADPRETLPNDILIPAEQESVLLSVEGKFPLSTISKPTLLLVGEEDRLIIGLSASMAKNSTAPMPGVDNPHPALRTAYTTTEAPVVWASLADSNHATLGVSGAYWWPQLKTNLQTRYFKPKQTFTLINPVLAHSIQKEKVLAFFDFTIRGQKTAFTRLIDQKYKSAGLSLEARNF